MMDFKTQPSPELDSVAAQIEDICAQHGVILRVTGGMQFYYSQIFYLKGEPVTQAAANAIAKMFKCKVPVTQFADYEMIEAVRR